MFTSFLYGLNHITLGSLLLDVLWEINRRGACEDGAFPVKGKNFPKKYTILGEIRIPDLLTELQKTTTYVTDSSTFHKETN